MKLIDQINGSALFAQSSNSASIATKDNLGRDITATYLTGIDLSNYYTKDETSGAEQLAQAFDAIPSDVATKGDVDSLAQSVSSTYYPKSNPSSFATEEWVNGQGFLTAHQDISNKLDSSAFSSVSGDFLTTSFSIPESATWNETSNVVQTNSAQWGQGGGGAISSYTSAWSDDVQPYGDFVINTLNEKYINSLISNSANSAKFAYNANSANSANYAETVNETYLENKGFSRNLSSEYGTVSIIHNNIIESTNSAISRVGNEGFVSSYGGEPSVGDSKPATYTWDKALPNTTITLDMGWSEGETLTYSANTNLTGEIILPTGTSTQTIDIPNATEIKVWTSNWLSIENAVVSAADSFETVVGELAWASAIPTYEYDSTNKISAINGSAIGGGVTGEFVPQSAFDELKQSYDALSSLFATYSGQWLLPNEGV